MGRMIFMGTPEFAVPSLAALVAAGHDVCAVYTQPARPSGRGRKMSEPAVKRWADAGGLQVHQPATLRTPEAVAEIQDLHAEIIVVVAFAKLLQEAVVAGPPLGVLNLHPSLLPKYRGPTPIPASILAGDVETGATVMQVDEGMDSGPVLAQVAVAVAPGDSTASLGQKLAVAGAAILVETVGRWLRREVRAIPQDHSLATYTRLLRKQDGKINWSEPAEVLARKIRAHDPWPGTFTTWGGSGVKVLAGRADPGLGGEPGSVVAVPGGVAVITGDGGLVLEQLQIEGRPPATGREFTAGRQDFVGSRLPN